MEKVTYKVWLTVEKCTTNTETGEEVFENLEEDTVSAGLFNTYDEAVEQMNSIHNINSGDFTK